MTVLSIENSLEISFENSRHDSWRHLLLSQQSYSIQMSFETFVPFFCFLLRLKSTVSIKLYTNYLPLKQADQYFARFKRAE